MNHLFAAYTQNIALGDGASFAARPLKQWRKQYQNLLGHSRASVGMPMDRPGGLIPVASNLIYCKTCRGAFTARVDVFKDSICTSCQPITAKISQTDKSYTDSKAYLEARGLTYEQNSYLGLPGQLEITQKPTDGPLPICHNAGSQTATIYKPNNTQFAQQGGVSSSARLVRLKYNTLNNMPVVNNGITVNGSIFNTASGAMGINSGMYHLEPTSGYFTKYKPEQTLCQRRNGNKAYCATT